MSNPWTSQVKYQDPATGISVGSPTLVRLGSGEILAAHDYHRKGTYRQPERDRCTTSVYRSPDHGLTWEHAADLQGFIWGTLFVNRGSVYLLGTSREYGSIVIRRSGDAGSTWTEPADDESGLLFRAGIREEPPNYHHSANNVLALEGRLYTACENNDLFGWPAGFRAMVVSAEED